MFDGTLSKYTGSNYTLEFRGDVKLFAKPFSILTTHKPTLKKEVER